SPSSLSSSSSSSSVSSSSRSLSELLIIDEDVEGVCEYKNPSSSFMVSLFSIVFISLVMFFVSYPIDYVFNRMIYYFEYNFLRSDEAMTSIERYFMRPKQIQTVHLRQVKDLNQYFSKPTNVSESDVNNIEKCFKD